MSQHTGRSGRHPSPGEPSAVTRRGALRHALRWALALVALAGGAGVVTRELRGWGRVPPVDWTLPLPRPILAAHRGGARLFPENTLEAFREATERYGCRFLELDARGSRDGVPVVIHDATLERTTDGSGPVHAQELAALQRLDAGYGFHNAAGEAEWAGRGVRIPTLEAVLRAFPQHVLSIEIKQEEPPLEAAVVAVIRRCGMEGRVVVGSTHHAVFQRVRALAPELPTFYSRRSGTLFFLALWSGLSRWYRPPHNVLEIPARLGALQLITPRVMRVARRLGLPVLPWTVNDAAEMERLLALGVDGIITDRPDRLAAVIAARQLA
ncbi:MAG TPA: glycerophosphodiester phosphodiesterase [bacterium]|nr:glycerophosphodiester phosphodiesterase [bacterium]